MTCSALTKIFLRIVNSVLQLAATNASSVLLGIQLKRFLPMRNQEKVLFCCCKSVIVIRLLLQFSYSYFLVIKVLRGHIDYSFACCWSPDDRYLATGNQDKTTRIYDIRNMSETLHVLRANLGAIRSLHFSNDGRFLAAAGTIRRILLLLRLAQN